MSIITIGTSNPIEFDTATLPATSIDALLRRGLSHVLGNEVASKVVSWRKRHEADWLKVDGQTLENYIAPTEDEEEVQREAFRNDMISAILEGTLGVRTYTSVAVDPLDVEMEKIAKQQVLVILAGQAGPDGKKLKFPKKDEVVTFANGATRSGPDMIAKRLQADGENIRKQAQKVLKDKAAKAKAAQSAVAEVSVDDL